MINDKFSTKDLLLLKTKEIIIRTGLFLNVKINRNKRKDEIAETIVKVILQRPWLLLNKLPEKEVLKLQQMVHSEGYELPVSSLNLVENCLSEMGFSLCCSKDGENKELIFNDLVKVLEPIIDDYVSSTKREEKYRKERLILGLLNLYGVLKFYELEMLYKKYIGKIESLELAQLIDDSYLFKTLAMDYPLILSGNFTSVFAEYPWNIQMEADSRKDIMQAEFTEEAVMAAGETDFPVPPGVYVAAFKKTMLSTGLTEAEADQWIGHIWMRLNNDETPNNIVADFLQHCSLSTREINPVISSFVEFTNNLPRWILKGNTSQYVFEKIERPSLMQQPPRLVMGPNMKKAGINFSQEDFDAMWHREMITPLHKIGRNDPCPCGSGKKYKKCCGSTEHFN